MNRESHSLPVNDGTGSRQSEASLGNGQTLSINPAPKSPVVATVERV